MLRFVGIAVALVVGMLASAGLTVPAAAQGGPSGLSIELFEDPFVCNGGTRTFGTVTGLDPGESLVFTSPQIDGGLPFSTREADPFGAVAMRWVCDAPQVWEISVVALSSGRSTSFNVTGVGSVSYTHLTLPTICSV